MSLEAKYLNCAIFLAGDFNRSLHPIVQSAVKAFHLKPTVTFPIRGNRTLDQILTNFPEFFSLPSSLPPFGLPDHLSMYMRPGIREKPSKSIRKIILSREKRPSKRASVGRFFLQVPWSDLLSPDLSCDLKLRTFTDIINLWLDMIMPECSIKVYKSDRPWLSAQLKQLITRRQKAFASGNQSIFKILRNKVNRERKRYRKVYYENEVESLRTSRPRDWWREMKQLCCSTKSTERDLNSKLHKDLVCEDAVLAEKINQAFVGVM